MTWLHFLNDCTEINKMLNASIQSLSTIHYPLSPAPALPCGSFEEKRPIVNEDEPPMDTKEHK